MYENSSSFDIWFKTYIINEEMYFWKILWVCKSQIVPTLWVTGTVFQKLLTPHSEFFSVFPSTFLFQPAENAQPLFWNTKGFPNFAGDSVAELFRALVL